MLKSLIAIIIFLCIYAAIAEKKYEWILLISSPEESFLDIKNVKIKGTKREFYLKTNWLWKETPNSSLDLWEADCVTKEMKFIEKIKYTDLNLKGKSEKGVLPPTKFGVTNDYSAVGKSLEILCK